MVGERWVLGEKREVRAARPVRGRSASSSRIAS